MSNNKYVMINLIIHSSYKNRISNLRKGMKVREKKNLYKLYIAIGIMCIVIGLDGVKSKNIFDIFFVILGIGNFIYSYSCYKEFDTKISK